MNLLYFDEHVCVCPPLTKHLSVSDEGDMIRIVTNPDYLPEDVEFELLANLAEEHFFPHFGAWENDAEFAVCFFPEGEDWAVALEISLPNGACSCLWVDAEEEEIATMLAPLVVATDMTEKDYDALAGMIPGLNFDGKYSVMVKNLADTIVALCYYHSIADNPVVFQLPYYERAFEKSLPRFMPCLIQPFIDICNAMKSAVRA